MRRKRYVTDEPVKFAAITIKGKVIEVRVRGNGEFEATIEGADYSHPLFEGLKKKLLNHVRVKSAKVVVPVCWWERATWKNDTAHVAFGTFTGIHASTENLLLKHDDGRTEQIAQYNSSEKYFPPSCAKQLAVLSAACDAADKKFDTFKDKHSINPKNVVRDAVAKIAGDEAVEHI